MTEYLEYRSDDADDCMIYGTLRYLEQSRVMTIPSVVTYPDFARDMLEFAFASMGAGGDIPVTDEMVERALNFFETAQALDHPEVTKHPRFVRDLLVHVLSA